MGRRWTPAGMQLTSDEERISAGFFARDVETVARALIGVTLLVEGVGGVIVETEAYDPDDPASHAFNGPTARNASMFGPPGHAYVYRSYGLHWCLNFVCTTGSAVLIRALEPTVGITRMIERRGVDDVRRLCAGPGRLCQALGVGGDFDGKPLDVAPIALWRGARPVAVGVGARVGITRAVDLPRRFGLIGSRFLSRPIAAEPPPKAPRSRTR